MSCYIKSLLQHIPALIVIIGMFVEITPIKINPISALLKYVGKIINSEVITELNKVSKKVDENEIDRIRWEILDFANSCRNHRKHTYDEFTHIIDLNTKYHKILESRNLTNGQVDLEFDYIKEVFRHCQDENSFL